MSLDTRSTEGPVQAQGSLGDPGPPATGERARELALFDLGIDSKLRACDLVQLRVRDVCHGDRSAWWFSRRSRGDRPGRPLDDLRASLS
jgi:hypothetical protein